MFLTCILLHSVIAIARVRYPRLSYQNVLGPVLIHIRFKIANWLLINVYMPCVGTAQREFLYSDMLSEIDALISSHPSCSCLIGGDFNVELDCNDNISMLVNNVNCTNKRNVSMLCFQLQIDFLIIMSLCSVAV